MRFPALLGLMLAPVLVLGCRSGDAPAPDQARAESATPAAAEPATEEGPAGFELNRPIPGTDWERERDLIGRVRRVETTRITESKGERRTKTEVLEFTATGQQARAWHDGQPSEEASLDEAGNVVERVSIPQHPETPVRTTRNLAFDDAGRVLERRITIPPSARSSAVDQTITYTYDAEGRVLSERYSPTSPGEGSVRETSYTYDADGDWLTRTENGQTEIREPSVEGPRKILVTQKGPELVLTEVFDRATGRLLKNEVSIADSHLAYIYGKLDSHGNWLHVTVQREHEDGTIDWIADVDRTIEYFD